MTIINTILDYRVSYPLAGGGAGSLLTLPLGTGTVLDYLGQRVEKLGRPGIFVVPGFEAWPGYAEGLAAGTGLAIEVLTPARLAERLTDCETSDYLLVLEPRNWPLAGFDLERAIEEQRSYRGATHAVGVGADVHATRELVECEPGGRVRRVQRFYNLASWPEVASQSISYSLVSARATAGVEFRSLRELRSKLAARGAMSRDVPLVSDVIDLGNEGHYLALHELALTESLVEATPRGFRRVDDETLIGPGCEVAVSARLVPPVVLQGGAVVEEGATIIGPALIGRGARVERGAVVAQAVVLPASTVPAEGTVRHRVVGGRVASTSERLSPEAEEAEFTVSQEVNGHGVSHTAAGPPEAGVDHGRRLHFAMKRATDVALSCVALLLLSPALLLIAVMVKLTSEGPVLFRHRREGRAGREFDCLKFRTMARDAHQKQRDLYAQSEVDGPQFKIRNDPRVTRLGRWLRATNLDELPQFINVLVGDMSLVGPRPSPFRENQICVPWRRARLSVRPGITGLWQLCRGDDNGDFHEWIYYDILYVRHFSIWLDTRIVAATIVTLGGQRSVPVSWLIPAGRLGPYRKRPSVQVATN